MTISAEERAALRTKKINVRRAHRASATKSVNQIEDAVKSSDVRRLRQLKLFLSDKLAVLSKRDEEVLALMEDDNLDAEVEQADMNREKIDLAILTIEDTLQTCRTSEKMGTSQTSSRRQIDSSSSVAEETGEDRCSLPPTTRATHDHHPIPITSISVSTHAVTGSVAPPIIALPTSGLSTSAPTMTGHSSSHVTMTAPSLPLPTHSPLAVQSVGPPVAAPLHTVPTPMGAPPHSTGSATFDLSTLSVSRLTPLYSPVLF